MDLGGCHSTQGRTCFHTHVAVDKLSSLQPVGLKALVFSWFWREGFVFLSGGAASHGRLFPHKSEKDSLLSRWVLPSNVTTEM